MRPLLPLLPPGYDLMLIARKPMAAAPFAAIRRAVVGLLKRAGLLTAAADVAAPDAS